MQKIDYNNSFRLQCLDVENLSMEQFDRSVASLDKLLPETVIRNTKRIIVTGCGDSYLAAVEAKDAFKAMLPGVQYKTCPAIDAARYIDLSEDSGHTLLVAISVSGSPARIAEVLERGNFYGCTTIALTDGLTSRAAQSARYVYHTNSPAGDNFAGLRTYYVSMVSLFIMAAAMAEKRGEGARIAALRQAVEQYKTAFYQHIEAMDDIAFHTAMAWKSKKFFEVTADGPMFWCGKFIAAKFVELSGDVCSVIDSENYFHVNGIMYPGEDIAELAIISSQEANVDRMVAAVNSQVGKGRRDVIVFSDKHPEELGITEQVIHCHLPVPPREHAYLLPLFAYLPAALLASYRAKSLNEPFFRGGIFMDANTLKNNPIRIV